MKRRTFHKGVMLAIAGVAASTLTKIAAASPVPKKKLSVCFKAGVLSTLLPDGSWNLWVHADPRQVDGPGAVRLLLEVATDENFNNIVAEEKHVALRKFSYMLRTNFKPQELSSELYFRFVAVDTYRGLVRHARFPESQASAVGFLKAKA